jgi:N utilization substance protein B
LPDYRRVAREAALRVLYEVDVGRQPARDSLRRALDQMAAGIRSGLTMAVRQAGTAMKPDTDAPAVFISRTTIRERDRVRRAVVRALERTASGFEPKLAALFDEAVIIAADGVELDAQIESALWALEEASEKPMRSLERTLCSAALQPDEIAAARRIAHDSLAKMRRVLEKRLEPGLVTARLAAALVRGALQHRDELDERLARLTGDWPMDRQSAVDRNILRLAAYEIAYRPETPAPVVLNEAVELAKRYSTDESGRFVNGVLAALVSRAEG